MSRKIIVRIEHDYDVEKPDSEYDGWKLISFGRRHSNYEDPDNYVKRSQGRLVPENVGLRRKLTVGLAHWLSYYEHTGSIWSLKGGGPQCPFDTVQLAGILIWTGKPKDIGAKSLEDRTNDAQSFLDTYNLWANGACYYYSIETIEGDDLESVGGFIGEDATNEAIAEVLQAGDVVKVEGDAAWVFKPPQGVELVNSHHEEPVEA